jgi:3-oxoacyl-[acyl-carrier protein] reductase
MGDSAGTRQLTGKTALVTGGGRGIGRAISLALAKAGAATVLTYRERSETAEGLVHEIERGGGRSIAVSMEVRNRESVRAGIREAEATFGGLDILVNNAGMNRPADFDQITDNVNGGLYF